MKVIVSNTLEDRFVNFVVVKSFEELQKLTGVDIVIIHKYNDSPFDACGHVTKLCFEGESKKFVYISSSRDTMLGLIVLGSGGACFDDEFYFEDEDELLALLEDLDESDNQSLSVLQAVDVLDDFVNAVSQGEDRATTPIMLDQARGSTKELRLMAQQQQTQLQTIGESTIDVFQQIRRIISSVMEKNAQISAELEKLESGLSDGDSGRMTFSNNIMFFAPYTYRSNAKLLLVREYAPCRYLTSFILGYLHHLHYELNRRPKLIFVVQKGKGVASKYSEYPVITQENMGLATLYNGEIVATNNPKKEVMKELLSKPNDVFVVVDRLYGAMDIVSGRVTKVCAVGSRSDIERYGLKPEETIFSVTRQPRQLFDLPVIKNFPIEAEARYAAYSRGMAKRYEVLDYKLGLKSED